RALIPSTWLPPSAWIPAPPTATLPSPACSSRPPPRRRTQPVPVRAQELDPPRTRENRSFPAETPSQKVNSGKNGLETTPSERATTSEGGGGSERWCCAEPWGREGTRRVIAAGW